MEHFWSRISAAGEVVVSAQVGDYNKQRLEPLDFIENGQLQLIRKRRGRRIQLRPRL